jgi:hypothetical protein
MPSTLFNARSIDNHPSRAVLHDVLRVGRRLSRRDTPAAIGFGRTRIGIEMARDRWGRASVPSSITPHGDAASSRARLEAKDLGPRSA